MVLRLTPAADQPGADPPGRRRDPRGAGKPAPSSVTAGRLVERGRCAKSSRRSKRSQRARRAHRRARASRSGRARVRFRPLSPRTCARPGGTRSRQAGLRAAAGEATEARELEEPERMTLLVLEAHVYQ